MDSDKQNVILRRRRPLVRMLTVGAVLFTAWHIFATFLWVTPPNPLRDVVPGTALSSYMTPWFSQGWSVFAPNPISTNVSMNIRGQVPTDGGKRELTPWVDAAQAEVKGLKEHNAFPSRAARLISGEIPLYRKAYRALTDQQKKIVQKDFFQGDDWLERLEAQLRKYGNSQAVTVYMKHERVMSAYATQVAKAMWGDSVVMVEYRVSSQGVVPYEDRLDPDAKLPRPAGIVPTGWRGALVMPGQNEQAFAEIFKPLGEKQLEAGDGVE